MNVTRLDRLSELCLELPCVLLCCLRLDDSTSNYEHVVGKQGMPAVTHDAMQACFSNHKPSTLMPDRCSREHTRSSSVMRDCLGRSHAMLGLNHQMHKYIKHDMEFSLFHFH